LEVILLPGMHGTANLYLRLMHALPADWGKSAPQYPADIVVGYDQLLRMVQFITPERPYLLVAESYSTPLAIRFAAARPKNLKGLILCAGFASSPVLGWVRLAIRLLGRVLFHFPPTNPAIEMFLLGRDADPTLLVEVRTAIRSVKPAVLAARLAEVLDCDVRADLAKVEVPVLCLQPEADRLVGPECFTEIERNTNLAVGRIRGPHLLFQREPERPARAIEEFARQIGSLWIE
jgi:pimeloyl-ACP methyl ester carboxylesterase